VSDILFILDILTTLRFAQYDIKYKSPLAQSRGLYPLMLILLRFLHSASHQSKWHLM